MNYSRTDFKGKKNYDFEAINEAALPRLDQLLKRLLPDGRLQGHEYTVLNPTRRDAHRGSFRINVNTGVWSDFATGDSGAGAIALYKYIFGSDWLTAAKTVASDIGYYIDESPRHATPRNKLPAPAHDLVPIPAGLTPTFKHPPTGLWLYTDASGKGLFFVARFDEHGKKRFSQCYYDGAQWIFKQPFQTDRPLYNLRRLTIESDKPVLIVEGEKAADAIAPMLSGYVVITSCGGSNASDKTDWTPLKGRRVTIWPDADKPGLRYAQLVSELAIKAGASSVSVIPISDEWTKGFDAADAVADGWTEQQVKELLSTAISASVRAEPAPAKPDVTPDSVPDKPLKPKRIKTLYELINIINQDFPKIVGFNEFTCCIEKKNCTFNKSKEWTDDDTIELERRLKLNVSFDLLNRAIIAIANDNAFNPAQDKVRELAKSWDNIPRLETWLIDYCNADTYEKELYIRELSKRWMIGVIARVMTPGCKRDDCLVLVGKQGIGKSRLAQIISDAIYPLSFLNGLPDLHSKDSKALLRGKIIVELAELSQVRKSDIESVKSFLSTNYDTFRPSYGRFEKTYQRTVSFIGTTNEDTFLNDKTGNRRFFPVYVSQINIDAFANNIEMLLAEAAHLYFQNEKWWISDEKVLEQAEKAREDAEEEDALDSKVFEIVENLKLFGKEITIPDILDKLEVHIQHRNSPMQRRIAAILKRHGFKRVRLGKTKRTVWVDAMGGRHGRHTDTTCRPPIPGDNCNTDSELSVGGRHGRHGRHEFIKVNEIAATGGGGDAATGGDSAYCYIGNDVVHRVHRVHLDVTACTSVKKTDKQVDAMGGRHAGTGGHHPVDTIRWTPSGGHHPVDSTAPDAADLRELANEERNEERVARVAIAGEEIAGNADCDVLIAALRNRGCGKNGAGIAVTVELLKESTGISGESFSTAVRTLVSNGLLRTDGAMCWLTKRAFKDL